MATRSGAKLRGRLELALEENAAVPAQRQLPRPWELQKEALFNVLAMPGHEFGADLPDTFRVDAKRLLRNIAAHLQL